MSTMLSSLESSVVAICDANNRIVGTGFVVEGDLILTCAHVIEAAGSGPDGTVQVRFRGEHEPHSARVMPEWWSSPATDDVAVLRLEGPLPADAIPLGFTRACNGHALRILGFPELPGGYEMAYAEGQIRGVVPHPDKQPMLQMDAQSIRRGMSGAPVLDLVTQRIVGMVSEYAPGMPLEWATTSETLNRICPTLKLHFPKPVEVYLTALGQFCRALPYVSLDRDIPLTAVYVRQQMRPKSVEKPPGADKQQSADEKAQQETEQSKASSGGEESSSDEQLVDQKQVQREENERHSRPVLIEEALARQAHLLVIGGPGTGKSTLLRHLAEEQLVEENDVFDGARFTLRSPTAHLPILVSLRGLAEREGDVTTCLRQQIEAELDKRLLNKLPENFLQTWAEQAGAAWLIALDGLDEILDLNRRRVLLKQLAQTAWPSGSRLLLTSRPDEFLVAGETFTPFNLLPFEPEQVETFARFWFPDKTLADAFLRSVKLSTLQTLTSVPLLLTVAAIVFEDEVKKQAATNSDALVDIRRVTLYDRFVTILVDEDRAPNRRMKEQFCTHFRTDLGETLFDYRREALECVALAAQETRDLKTALIEFLRQLPNWDKTDAHRKAEAVLNMLVQQRTGLVIQRGTTYEFIHPTFRDYLAAAALVKACGSNQECMWQRVISRWQDEHWREIALLTLGILSEEGVDVTPLLNRIPWHRKADRFLRLFDRRLVSLLRNERLQALDVLKEEDTYVTSLDILEEEDTDVTLLLKRILWSHKAHQFLRLFRRQIVSLLREKCLQVLAILSEDSYVPPMRNRIPWRRIAGRFLRHWLVLLLREEALYFVGFALGEQVQVPPNFAATVVGSLLYAARRMSEFDILRSPNALTVLAELRTYALRASDDLLVLACDVRVDAGVRQRVAETLGQLGQVDNATQAWLAIARDVSVGATVRQWAAETLGRLGHANEAIPILLALAHDKSVSAGVRERAAEVLNELGKSDDLLALACDERADTEVRRTIAETLGKLGRVDIASQAWLALARTGHLTWWVPEEGKLLPLTYEDAADKLGKLGRADDLLVLARDEHVDARMRRRATETLGQLCRVDDLIALTRDVRIDAGVSERAAEALGRLGQIEEAVLILLTLASDERIDAEIRQRTAEALGKLGQVDEAAQTWLVLIRNERADAEMCKAAAHALGNLGRSADLLALAYDEHVEASIRQTAVEVLGKLGLPNETIQSWLMLAGDVRVGASVRRTAAETLGKLDRIDEAIQAWLMLARDVRVGASVRRTAAKTLGKLKRTDDLMELARDEQVDAWMRGQAAEVLGQLGQVDEAVQVWLALARNEHVGALVGRTAAEALGQLYRGADLLALARDTRVEAEVRAESTKLLGNLVDSAALLALVCDEHVGVSVRGAAAKALGESWRAEEAAIPILLALARDERVATSVRVASAKALGNLGHASKAIQAWLALAQDEGVEPSARWTAAEALGKLGKADKATLVLLALARDERVAASVRVASAKALGNLGHASKAIQAWLALAQDDGVEASVRRTAAEALIKLGRADDVVSLLLALACDERVDGWMRGRAAEVLGQLDRTNEATQAWLALACDERVDVWTRASAAEALGQLGRDSDLLALAYDECVNASVRVTSAEALGKLGRVDEVMPILLTLVCDEREEAAVRVASAEALGKLGRADSAAPILLTLACNEHIDASVRVASAEALGKLDRVDGLLALVRDERVDASVRVASAEALGKLGRADDAVPLLLALACDERVDAWNRRHAAVTLGELGRSGKAEFILLMLARDERVGALTRIYAAEALDKLGRSDDVTSILLVLACDERMDTWGRGLAVETLIKLDRADDLMALACYECVDAEVRKQAADAIRARHAKQSS